MKRTKFLYVSQDGIDFHEKVVIMDISVSHKHFLSFIIHESTDISDTQIFVIVVRYFNLNKYQNHRNYILDNYYRNCLKWNGSWFLQSCHISLA
uniref:Uncharacterized protein n=1 Tax=Octopus bimaculoides TaxID=37653 RepID=A0A0L8HMQ6_OCTBM